MTLHALHATLYYQSIDGMARHLALTVVCQQTLAFIILRNLQKEGSTEIELHIEQLAF
jgi:hypothetical protein